MARTKQTARKSSGGKAPRKMAAVPSSKRPMAMKSTPAASAGTIIPLEPPSPMTAGQAAMIEAENKLRATFASAPRDPSIADPFVSLLNVYRAPAAAFVFQPLDVDEAAVPMVLTKYRDTIEAPLGESSICPQDEFARRWAAFTCNMFAGLDWRNVFCAGGSVLGCVGASSQGFGGSDIDLFLYGLDSDDAANAKLREICAVVARNSKSKGDVIRTHRAVTILGEYPYRHVQIILKIYRSPAEVLLGFDVDACCFGFDGESVYCPPRAQRALNKRYNLVNMTRRSLTYEVRLKKYAKRGFAVAVPDLNKARVNPDVLRRNAKDVQGLAKLLIAEYEIVKGRDQAAMMRMSRIAHARVTEFTADAVDEYESVHQASDYADVFIPWGPKTYSRAILSMLSARDKAAYFQQPRGAFQHKHIFVSGVDAAVAGPSGHEVWCMYCRTKTRLECVPADLKHVPQALEWIKDQPAMQDLENGRQRALLTGSFFPVVDADWTKGCYLPEHVAPPVPHPLQVVEQSSRMSFGGKAGTAAFGARPRKELAVKAAKRPAATSAAAYASAPFGASGSHAGPTPYMSSAEMFGGQQANPFGGQQANPFGGQQASSGYVSNPFGTTAKRAAPAAAHPFGAAPAAAHPFGAAPAAAHPFGAAPAAAHPFGAAPAPSAATSGYVAASAFGAGRAPSSHIAALTAQLTGSVAPLTAALLSVKALEASGMLTADGKAALKDLVLQREYRIMGVMDAFTIDHDVTELCDTLVRLATIVAEEDSRR